MPSGLWVCSGSDLHAPSGNSSYMLLVCCQKNVTANNFFQQAYRLTSSPTAAMTQFRYGNNSIGWKDWYSPYITNSDLIREGAKTIIRQTNAGGTWNTSPPVVKIESTQGMDQAICLTSMTTKSGSIRIQTHMNGDYIAFRFINNDGTIKAVYKIDASNKTTGWEVL